MSDKLHVITVTCDARVESVADEPVTSGLSHIMRRIAPYLLLALVAITGCSQKGLGASAWSTNNPGTTCEPCLNCPAPRSGGSGMFSKTSHCGPNRYNARHDCHVACTCAKQRAERALKRYRKQSGYRPSCHFVCGFEQAYIDIADGGTGALPPLPPARYWHTCYRTEAGYARADEWFEGYRVGASLAESEGMKQYNHIAVSPPLPDAGPQGGACGVGIPGGTGMPGQGFMPPGSMNAGYQNPNVGSNHGGTPVIGAPVYVGPGAKQYPGPMPSY